jgi:hypothetical protein
MDYKRRYNVIARKNAIRKICSDYIVGYKTNKPCMDCGVIYPPYVLDFDHLGDKLFNLSSQTHYTSLERIQKEIAKCDLVCSNCHRIRTHNRRNKIDN